MPLGAELGREQKEVTAVVLADRRVERPDELEWQGALTASEWAMKRAEVALSHHVTKIVYYDPQYPGSWVQRENATQARARLENLRFDLLILDVMMPGESGFDLARSIRENSAVPILMLTARSDSNDRIQGLEIGADDYVPKPFEPRELSLRITNILKRAQTKAGPAREQVAFGEFVFHVGREELRQGDRCGPRTR